MEIIDSLFHNFYVPPVIFALVKDEDGEDTRVCVDGKQRLTSIQKFFDGQVRNISLTAVAGPLRSLDVCRLLRMSCCSCTYIA